MSQKRIVSVLLVAGGIAVCWIAALTRAEAQQARSERGVAVAIDNDDIGGVVRSTKGPEAGVWVIAETTDLSTKFARIVVTDDQGRYVVPDLPKATYKLWVRGYGLVDSRPVQAVPGKLVNLTAVVAPSERAAAQYYPASYWYSLIQLPPKDKFPIGDIKSQEEWITHMKMGSIQFQQMGSRATREFPEPLRKFGSVDAWQKWLTSGESPVGFPSKNVGKLGAAMYVDWLDRITAGEYPKETPPRPQSVERNLVVSLWDWSDAKGFVHDEVATDKRNPKVNANGPVYGVEQHSDDVLLIVDPIHHSARRVKMETLDPNMPVQWPTPATLTWGNEAIRPGRASLHNPMMDQKGRVWITTQIRMGKNQPDFCKAGSSHPSAKRFPLDVNIAEGDRHGRELAVYDPTTKKFTLVDTCYGTHHLQFAEDADHTLWTSGGNARGGVVGWLKTKVFDETGDLAKAQGWLPYILDTNGNGKLDEYVEPEEPVEPTKDKRVEAETYGVIPNPVDGSVWQAEPGTPGRLLRTDPKTGLTEIYEPPFNNPKSPVNGYNPKGVDVDRSGVIWTGLAGSGHIASFDRRECKVLNGPTATGQHCPEGWTLYATPGPKLRGADVNGDFLYYHWVDQFDTFGLGKNVSVTNGTNSDSLVALLPDNGKVLTFRVPYPLGFYTRGLDGRIDDLNAGWKGRGLWTTYATVLPWHIEGGKGATSKAVKLQLRPNPLAK